MIGKTHLVCEDYALDGNRLFPYVIISDGCSSSCHTDVGARLLSLCLEDVLVRIVNKKGIPSDKLHDYYHYIGNTAIQNAYSKSRSLGLDPQCLDASASLAFKEPLSKKFITYMYGDGHIIHKGINGRMTHVRIGFEKETPFYLSYTSDSGKVKTYDDFSRKINPRGNIKTTTITVYENDGLEKTTDLKKYNCPTIFTFDGLNTDFLAIASDGIGTFASPQKGGIPAEEAVKEVLAFRLTNGRFVKRRLKRAIECYNKQGVYNHDDISLGVIKVN
jgi:hypothetical protein